MISVEAYKRRGVDVRERVRNAKVLDKFRPTETVNDINHIDFDRYKSDGKKLLLLDAEGTFVKFNGWDVDSSVIDTIKRADFDHVAIVTNKKPRDAKTFVKLNWWAYQLGADIVFTPDERQERKPRPHMLNKAMQYFEVKREETLMVGDKLSADIQAANAAGVDSIWLKKRRGKEDLTGDKLARRPVEKLVHWYHHRKERVTQETIPAEAFSTKEVIVYKTLETTHPENLPEWTEEIDEKIWEKSKIVNLGGPIIELIKVSEVYAPEEDPTNTTNLSTLLHEVGETYGKKFDEFMYEHGRSVATASTLARIPLGLVAAGFILADKPVLAQLTHAVALGTDGVDGWASRKSKEGPSKEGGTLDQRVDKFYSLVVELALAIKDGGHRKHVAARLLREIYVLGYSRPNAERKGQDTSAVMSGKVSTNLVSAAEFAAMTGLARSRPIVNEIFQYGADAAKWYSAVDSQIAWEQRALDKEKYEEATQKLMALAA